MYHDVRLLYVLPEGCTGSTFILNLMVFMGTRSLIYFTFLGDMLMHVSPRSLMLFGLARVRDRYHFGTL